MKFVTLPILITISVLLQIINIEQFSEQTDSHSSGSNCEADYCHALLTLLEEFVKEPVSVHNIDEEVDSWIPPSIPDCIDVIQCELESNVVSSMWTDGSLAEWFHNIKGAIFAQITY